MPADVIATSRRCWERGDLLTRLAADALPMALPIRGPSVSEIAVGPHRR
ncbi:hypothetical protein [Micromonospora sp. NBC_01638]|nr:hypothetical protein OG811_22395 [Micromonospora sp. NBC_01638]